MRNKDNISNTSVTCNTDNMKVCVRWTLCLSSRIHIWGTPEEHWQWCSSSAVVTAEKLSITQAALPSLLNQILPSHSFVAACFPPVLLEHPVWLAIVRQWRKKMELTPEFEVTCFA